MSLRAQLTEALVIASNPAAPRTARVAAAEFLRDSWHMLGRDASVIPLVFHLGLLLDDRGVGAWVVRHHAAHRPCEAPVGTLDVAFGDCAAGNVPVDEDVALSAPLVEAIAGCSDARAVVDALARIAEGALRAQWRATLGLAVGCLLAAGPTGVAKLSAAWLELAVVDALHRGDVDAAQRLVSAAGVRPDLLVGWLRIASRAHPAFASRLTVGPDAVRPDAPESDSRSPGPSET